MSDEQRPLPLRLRPRATPTPTSNPEPAAPPVPVESAPALEQAVPESGAELAGGDLLRLRLRPKTPPPEGLSAETPVPFSNPPMEPPPPAIPKFEPAQAETPVQETPSQEPQAVEVTAPDPVPEPEASIPMPESVVVPEPVPVPVPAYVPPPSPHHRPMPPVHAPTPPPTIKADKWLSAIVILVAVMAAAFWGVHYLSKNFPNNKPTGRLPSSKTEETKPAVAESESPRPHLVDNPKSEAGKTIARVRDMVAEHDRREREEGTERIIDSQKPDLPAKPTPSVPVSPGTSTPRTVIPEPPTAVAEPTQAPQPAQPEPPPPPSEAFRVFVTSLRVNGVFQGENARAMLNGKTYAIGDLVDAKLNITFFKVDPDARQLIFRDDSGATVSRRY